LVIQCASDLLCIQTDSGDCRMDMEFPGEELYTECESGGLVKKQSSTRRKITARGTFGNLDASSPMGGRCLLGKEKNLKTMLGDFKPEERETAGCSALEIIDNTEK